MTSLREMVEAQHQDMLRALQSYKQVAVNTGNADGMFATVDPLYIPAMGVRVRVTEWGWTVLARQLVNWRLLDCRNHPFDGVPNEISGWKRAWCYPHDQAFMALMAAIKWSGKPDTEPSGWIKSLPDQRRYGEPHPSITQE